MILPTTLISLLLIAQGVGGYAYAADNATEEDPASITALIPAFFGAALLLCAALAAFKPNLYKHVFHGAAVLGLLGLVGALMRPIGKLNKGEEIDWQSVPVLSQVNMAQLSLIFVVLCVNSFIQARVAKKRAAAS